MEDQPTCAGLILENQSIAKEVHELSDQWPVMSTPVALLSNAMKKELFMYFCYNGWAGSSWNPLWTFFFLGTKIKVALQQKTLALSH